MPKITCQASPGATYADLPANNTIYVLRGTTVNFKLAGPGLPDGSVPASVAATFNTTSTSQADVKPTDVTCGSLNMTAYAIVYDLAPTITPEDNFTGRSLTDLGVDERVNLGVAITPAGVTAAQAGGLSWEVVGNKGGKYQGTLKDADKEGKAKYIAPYLTSASLTFPANSLVPAPTSLRRTVDLTLIVQSGPCKGKSVAYRFTIHTPQAVMRDVRNTYRHAQNKPSAGFLGDIYLRPLNVSFKTLNWREGGGVAKAWAGTSAAPGLPGGYFIYDHGKKHFRTGTDATGGTSGAMKVAGGNLLDGCWVMQVDNVYTGWNQFYPLPYSAPPYATTPVATNVASRMVWPIYWQYSVPDDLSAGWTTFQKAEHAATMAADGSVTISKAGASKTFALAEGSQG